MKYTKKLLNAAISYWTKILNESYGTLNEFKRNPSNAKLYFDIYFDNDNAYDCSSTFIDAARQGVGKVFDFDEKNLDDVLNAEAWTDIIINDPVLKPLLYDEPDPLDIVNSLEEIDESIDEEELRQGLLIAFKRPSVDADNDDFDFNANEAKALLDLIISRLIELFRKHGLMAWVPDNIKFKAFFLIPKAVEDLMYLTILFDTKPNEHNDSKPIEDEDF